MEKTNARQIILAASLICADMTRLKETVKGLEDGGIDYIHFDVMDGVFVPRLGMHPELLADIRSITDLPVDVHVMTQEPAPYIPEFAKAGADIIVVHAEAIKHLHNTIKLIRDLDMKAGVTLNYATPLNVLDYIIDDIALVQLMAINPGIVGHKLIPGVYQKIADLRKKVDDLNKDIIIEVDGGVTFESAPKMLKAGADMFVCGTSTIFRPEWDVAERLKELRKILENTNNAYDEL